MKPEILEHFQKHDPKIYEFMSQYKDDLNLTAAKPSTYFFRLSREIASQQLHSNAAQAIWGRFEGIMPSGKVTPTNVLKATVEEMRACGFSYAKANYIHNVAEAFKADANYLLLDQLDDEEVIELLTKIKGIGRWTAEMFLMFTLGRENVFSYGDLGLKKGLIKVYKLKKEPDKAKIDKLIKNWAPYKTYGALTLWRALDNE